MIKYTHINETHNKTAASIILPKILELTKASSIVDVGCGSGSFLSVLQDLGVKDLMGIEGDWLDRENLYVKSEIIQTADLQKLFHYSRKFDLAICLEVVEHLEKSAAETIVETLSRLSNVILFSAAIPGQGGQNHINEQWSEYWVEKFRQQGYTFYDIAREMFWNEDKVDYWYKQNMFIVIKDGTSNFNLEKKDKLLNIVHPELFQLIVNSRNELYKNYTKLAWGEESIGKYSKLLLKSILKKIKILD